MLTYKPLRVRTVALLHSEPGQTYGYYWALVNSRNETLVRSDIYFRREETEERIAAVIGTLLHLADWRLDELIEHEWMPGSLDAFFETYEQDAT